MEISESTGEASSDSANRGAPDDPKIGEKLSYTIPIPGFHCSSEVYEVAIIRQ